MQASKQDELDQEASHQALSQRDKTRKVPDTERREIERPGARVSYELSGESGAPAIVLGHGLLCDGRMWGDIPSRLAQDFRVINVDLRGHRFSRVSRRYTLEDIADDWLAILDRESIDRAIFAGLSMGGMVALRVALSAGERVCGLVLIATSAQAESPFVRWKFRAMAALVRRVGYVDAFVPTVTTLTFAPHFVRERADLVDRQLAIISAHDPKQLY